MSSTENTTSGSRHDKQQDPCVVIVGRPNVGKSTLFNRLYGKRRSLVHDEPGVTRDRIIEKAVWWQKKRPFPLQLIDTGGIGGARFAAEIENQVQIALQSANLVLFVLDGEAGPTPADQEILRSLQKAGVLQKIPTIGVINKLDHVSRERWSNDFFELGMKNLLGISAEHGIGIDELQETIRDLLTPKSETEESEEEVTPTEEKSAPEIAEEAPIDHTLRLAVVGRPNVGKSTLINALLHEERMITSPIAGTTVDSIDTPARIFDRDLVLIDTAGIRRKSKTEQGVEVLSVVQTRKALDRCNVAALLIDADEGITDQDEKIAGLIDEVGCAVMIVVNKWDLMKRKGFTQEMAAEHIRSKTAFMRHAPILFTSAKNKMGLDAVVELAVEILEHRQLRISTKELTEFIKMEAGVHNTRNVKFYMSHQAGTNPPTFVSHVSEPKNIHYSLKRHFINAIRERWGYMGSPVRVVFRKSANTP